MTPNELFQLDYDLALALGWADLKPGVGWYGTSPDGHERTFQYWLAEQDSLAKVGLDRLYELLGRTAGYNHAHFQLSYEEGLLKAEYHLYRTDKVPGVEWQEWTGDSPQNEQKPFYVATAKAIIKMVKELTE